VPASPFAHPLVLRPDQIVRFLRLITSPACRGEKRVPLSAIAAMCGVSRLALYRVLWTGRVSAEMAELLTPTREDDSAAELVAVKA
jgi:hypothetical protein